MKGLWVFVCVVGPVLSAAQMLPPMYPAFAPHPYAFPHAGRPAAPGQDPLQMMSMAANMFSAMNSNGGHGSNPLSMAANMMKLAGGMQGSGGGSADPLSMAMTMAKALGSSGSSASTDPLSMAMSFAKAFGGSSSSSSSGSGSSTANSKAGTSGEAKPAASLSSAMDLLKSMATPLSDEKKPVEDLTQAQSLAATAYKFFQPPYDQVWTAPFDMGYLPYKFQPLRDAPSVVKMILGYAAGDPEVTKLVEKAQSDEKDSFNAGIQYVQPRFHPSTDMFSRMVIPFLPEAIQPLAGPMMQML